MAATSNARWIFASHVAKTLLQLGVLAILSRLLGAADYGLMAMAMVVVAMGQILQDMGTSAVIVQKQQLDETLKSTTFWLNLAVGVAILLLLSGAASILAGTFGSPGLVPVLSMLALLFPIQSAGAVHQALLERESRFRVIAAIEVASGLAGSTAGVLLALQGWGVDALVCQVIATAAIATVLYWWCSRWRPALVWSPAALREVWRFGAHLTAFTVVGFFSRYADAFIVGRFLGETLLGIYSQAIRLMTFPLHAFTFVAGRALFPVMSRQQGDLAQMAALYWRALNVVAALTVPLLLGLWVVRREVVEVLLGPRWAEVSPLLFWLAPVGVVQCLVSTTGSVFKATGRTDLLLLSGLVGASMHVAGFAIGALYGLEAVAIGYFFAALLSSVPCFWLTAKALQVPARHCLMAVQGPLAAGVAMVLLLLPLRDAMLAAGQSAAALLVGSAFAGAAIYAAAILAMSRPTLTLLRELAR